MKFIRHISLFMLLSMILSCSNSFFYHPDKLNRPISNKFKASYEDIYFDSIDGTKLHGWFIPSTKTPLGTVIHFHGNAENMTSHINYVDWLPDEGFNLFVFDYRGYGKSLGSSNHKGVYLDSVAAVKYIKTRPDINQEKIFLLGQSLGGSYAISTFANNKFKGIRAIAVDSTFSSYRKIAKDVLKKIPLISFLRSPLSFIFVNNSNSPETLIGKIAPVPILFIHGTNDAVIPHKHSLKLYELAKEPKKLIIIEGGEHTNAFSNYGNRYKKELTDFFKGAT